jgi:ubiquinone/menaquinone biosynthesis C-methylase UbiE
VFKLFRTPPSGPPAADSRVEQPSPQAAEPCDRFSGLASPAWLETLIRSIDEPVIDGAQMPGFPDATLQINTVGHAGAHPLREAFMFFTLVEQYTQQLGRPLGRTTRLLDFGCGWGRILRFFLRDCRAAHLCGVDVDPTLVEVCRSTFPYATFDAVQPLPPTVFPDASFDVITAYSVFSHLAEHASLAWVHEFARILKPGGVMLVTTQRRDFIAFCESVRGQEHGHGWHQALARSFVDTQAAYAAYDAGQYLYAATGGGPSRPADFYGEALIPEGYVRTHYTRALEFVDFVSDPQRLAQALIVMQKR